MGELMTGFATTDFELSRMTVGGLNDLGYYVNYDEADVYDVSDLNPACSCTSRVRQLEGTGSDTDDSPKRRRKLSAEGRETAVEYGLDQLEKREQERAQYRYSDGSSDYDYIGSKIIMVLYEVTERSTALR
jgi:hypothetical protein